MKEFLDPEIETIDRRFHINFFWYLIQKRFNKKNGKGFSSDHNFRAPTLIKNVSKRQHINLNLRQWNVTSLIPRNSSAPLWKVEYMMNKKWPSRIGLFSVGATCLVRFNFSKQVSDGTQLAQIVTNRVYTYKLGHLARGRALWCQHEDRPREKFFEPQVGYRIFDIKMQLGLRAGQFYT